MSPIRDFSITVRRTLRQYEHVEITTSGVVSTDARDAMGQAIDEIEGIINEKYRGGQPEKVPGTVPTATKPANPPTKKPDSKPATKPASSGTGEEGKADSSAKSAAESTPTDSQESLTLDKCKTKAHFEQFASENNIDLTGAKNNEDRKLLCEGKELPKPEAKTIPYDREKEEHRAKFSKTLTEVLDTHYPEWKKDESIKGKAQETSLALVGEPFIGEDGEILTSFISEMKGGLGI